MGVGVSDEIGSVTQSEPGEHVPDVVLHGIYG